MEPYGSAENGPLQEKIPFGNHNFRVPCYFLGGVPPLHDHHEHSVFILDICDHEYLAGILNVKLLQHLGCLCYGHSLVDSQGFVSSGCKGIAG